MIRIAQTSHHRHISTLAALLCLTLAGCGGGGGSDTSTSTSTSTDGAGTTTTTTTTDGTTTTTTTDASGNIIPTPNGTDRNVALARNGGVASATYDTAHATYINDGATTGSAWTGAATNDALTVAFDKTYHISGFTLHTNATNSVDTRIELSADGTTYTAVGLFGGSSGISCTSLSMGSGKIACSLSSMPQASRIRVVVTATASIVDKRLYELEVTGQ